MKKYAILFLKFAIPLAIIAFLIYRVDQKHPGQFARLWEQPKDWTLLLTGFCLVLVAVCLTFVRWWVLVRALDLPFRLSDALRLGFLGFLLNFAGLGSVGGDLLKAVFLARLQPGRRTHAVATVLLDRVVGLYVLVLVASVAMLISGVWRLGPFEKGLCDVTLLAATIGTTAAALALFLPLREGGWFSRLRHLPYVGGILGRLVTALHAYRRRLNYLAAVLALSVTAHALLPLAFYAIGQALFPRPPAVAEHFVIGPLALCTGVIPTPGGMGTFELAMDYLYHRLAPASDAEGLVVALAYRLITFVVAGIGMAYYAAGRREVQSLLKEAEAEQPHV